MKPPEGLCANIYDRTDDVGNTQEHVRARGDGIGRATTSPAAYAATGLGEVATITGTPGDDILLGDDGLSGGVGTDALNGGPGSDRCDGGRGPFDSADRCERRRRIP